MNALNHDQNSQSSFGTMKNGTKIGPSSAQTALAISPKATIASEMTFASVTTISSSQYSRFARIDQASGWTKCCHKLVEMVEHQFERPRVQDVGETGASGR